MSPRLLKIGQLLLMVAMLSACGGHWLLLQSVAWTSMVVNFSQKGDLSAAITKTFDGQHLCPLCKQIKAAKANEKKQEMRVVAEKLNLFHQPSIITLARPREFRVQSIGNCLVVKRANEPPTPPPRAATV